MRYALRCHVSNDLDTVQLDFPDVECCGIFESDGEVLVISPSDFDTLFINDVLPCDGVLHLGADLTVQTSMHKYKFDPVIGYVTVTNNEVVLDKTEFFC